MTEAPSHLIRLPLGRIRVLRLTAHGDRCYARRYDVEKDEHMCQLCGCTYTKPCHGACAWANRRHTLCTACAEELTR